jgi:hypothetical protein
MEEWEGSRSSKLALLLDGRKWTGNGNWNMEVGLIG